MLYFDRDVAIVMLADVDVVLGYLVQRLDTSRRALPLSVQPVGSRLYRPFRGVLVKRLPYEGCRVLAHDVLLCRTVYSPYSNSLCLLYSAWSAL